MFSILWSHNEGSLACVCQDKMNTVAYGKEKKMTILCHCTWNTADRD